MTRVSMVEVYPYGGWRDQPWDDDPLIDRFARCGRAAVERYSELVAEAGADLNRSLVRVFATTAAESDDVLLVVDDRTRESFEAATVHLPMTAAGLDDAVLARLALEVCHQACLALARARGAAPHAFERAHDTALADGIGYVWTSRWKASPDRHHQARVALRVEPDGWGTSWVEVAPRAAGGDVGAGGAGSCPGNLAALGRAFRDLRWQSSAEVGARTTDAMGSVVDAIAAEVGRLGPVPQRGVLPYPQLPVGVDVATASVRAPEAAPTVEVHSIANGYPYLVPEAVTELLDQVQTRALASWWQTSGVPRLDISLVVDRRRPRTTSTKNAGDLFVDVGRSADDLQGDPVTVVLGIVQEGIDRAARRTGIAAIRVPDDVLPAPPVSR